MVKERRDPATAWIKEVIRREFRRVAPEERYKRYIELMKPHRRRLSWSSGDAFVGIISRRDLLGLRLEDEEKLIHELTKHIMG